MLADAVIPCLRSGRPEDALELGRRAQRLAEGADRGTRIRSSLMLGTALVFTGGFEAGRELVSAAADLAESHPDLSGELRAYVGRGLRLAGYHDRALAVLEELVATARAEGSLGLLPYALARLGDLELERGRWTTAGGLLDEAIRLARETGQGADEGLALGTLGWLEAAQGRDDDCRAHSAAALDHSGAARNRLAARSCRPSARSARVGKRTAADRHPSPGEGRPPATRAGLVRRRSQSARVLRPDRGLRPRRARRSRNRAARRLRGRRAAHGPRFGARRVRSLPRVARAWRRGRAVVRGLAGAR